MFDLPKAYEGKNVEKKWYDFWLKNNYFVANAKSEKPAYTIVMPPPNVTGVLHMGHALDSTLQDILIRWKRMSNYEALWLPGFDHAGIATQTVVERHFMRTTGKRRTDFKREEFVKEIWNWKEKSESQIIEQLKRLGTSCDWTRKRFTMDSEMNRAVRVMFKKLFDKGLIFRDYYLVNWDPVTQTALADDEVEHEERSGFLWYFSYPLSDGSGSIVVATTRPETMLGDTAVAVAPKDERYTKYVGKEIRLPLTGRLIPIIVDDHVDPAFGTGAVKVTPAHDHQDYQIGLRHNLPMINIMTQDGRVNENGGKFANLTMEEAREKVVEEMKKSGFLVKVEPHTNRVGVSYRSKATIEPHLSKQWFVKLSSFKETLRSIVEEKKCVLLPNHWDSTYYYWIDNLRDWCISRQLWWGHQIPIWYNKNDPEKIICHSEDGVPEEVLKNPDDWYQDPDVLDTWFSSALWPFSTLGWPNETEDLKKFYPNSTLVTGHDILFFWVARMLMMGTNTFQEPPFAEVYMHGLIYGKSYWRKQPDGGIAFVSNEERKEYDLGKTPPPDVIFRWEKMSKSKGNVLDPDEVISEYGADAMRMALTSSVTTSRHIDLDRRRFEEWRNFTNKIWNGARFVLMNIEENKVAPGLTHEQLSSGLDFDLLTLEDRWILERVNSIAEEVNRNLKNYTFDQAAQLAYNFYWNDFCANFVEIIKPVLSSSTGTEALRANKQKIALIVLIKTLRLLHPMAPFITEELFQILKKRFEGISLNSKADILTQETLSALLAPACIVAPYPQPIDLQFSSAKEEFETVDRFVYAIRNLRGEMGVPTKMATDVLLVASDSSDTLSCIERNQHILRSLVKITEITFIKEKKELPQTVSATVSGVLIFIPLSEELLSQELNRLMKEEKRLQDLIVRAENQLNNKNFTDKAPPELVAKQREQLKEWLTELETIQNRANSLKP